MGEVGGRGEVKGGMMCGKFITYLFLEAGETTFL